MHALCKCPTLLESLEVLPIASCVLLSFWLAAAAAVAVHINQLTLAGCFPNPNLSKLLWHPFAVLPQEREREEREQMDKEQRSSPAILLRPLEGSDTMSISATPPPLWRGTRLGWGGVDAEGPTEYPNCTAHTNTDTHTGLPPPGTPGTAFINHTETSGKPLPPCTTTSIEDTFSLLAPSSDRRPKAAQNGESQCQNVPCDSCPPGPMRLLWKKNVLQMERFGPCEVPFGAYFGLCGAAFCRFVKPGPCSGLRGARISPETRISPYAGRCCPTCIFGGHFPEGAIPRILVVSTP